MSNLSALCFSKDFLGSTLGNILEGVHGILL